MQFGLDDFVMDRIVSYDVKGSDGKTVKVVLGDELEGFIKVYNTIEKEIGVDNLKDYKFKENALETLHELLTNYPEDAILVTGSLAFAAYIKQNLKRG